MKFGAFAVATILTQGAFANEKYFLLSGAKSLVILGSEESRSGVGFHFQMAKPDRRLSFRQNRAKLVQEAYALSSTGGIRGISRDTQFNVGLLFMGRFELGQPGTFRAFWETGWGLQYVNNLSPDLDLKFNSTPTLGAGFMIPKGDQEWIIEARYLHMSNAGTRLPNKGQNWISLLVGYKF